jgi:hypothetical protein
VLLAAVRVLVVGLREVLPAVAPEVVVLPVAVLGAAGPPVVLLVVVHLADLRALLEVAGVPLARLEAPEVAVVPLVLVVGPAGALLRCFYQQVRVFQIVQELVGLLANLMLSLLHLLSRTVGFPFDSVLLWFLQL